MTTRLLKIYLLISFISFFYPAFSSAQSNYKPAHLVNMQGDTLSGLINDLEWSRNPTSIGFKENPQSKERFYTPAEIKAAMIDSGDYYISAFLHVDRNYVTKNDITKVYSTDETKVDTLFLRLLTKGHLSLYLFRDENEKNHFYLVAEKNGFQELISKKVAIKKDGKDYVISNNGFRTQLFFAMHDCSSVM